MEEQITQTHRHHFSTKKTEKKKKKNKKTTSENDDRTCQAGKSLCKFHQQPYVMHAIAKHQRFREELEKQKKKKVTSWALRCPFQT